MIKETVEYVDYDGNQRKEDCWFHLTEAEIVELELTTPGGLTKKINQIIEANDMPSMIEIFKDLLLMSYGEKSPDGRRFIKTAALKEAFKQTEAYSMIFMKLVTDAEAAAKFINGIIPAKAAEELAKQNIPAKIASGANLADLVADIEAASTN